MFQLVAAPLGVQDTSPVNPVKLETCRLDGPGQLKQDNTSTKSIAISPVKDEPLL